MLKKVLSSAILLAAVNASAGENYFDNEWDAKGLIAIEGAGGSANLIKNDTSVTPSVATTDSTSSGALSLKLGGESKHYRLFLAGTYYMLDAPSGVDEASAASLGLQIDYLIRAGEHFNIFMGLNGGYMFTDFEVDVGKDQTTSETNSDAYAGAQVGVNIDIIDSLGVELGGRYKHVYSGNNVAAIDNMYEGYAAIVFKFTGDY